MEMSERSQPNSLSDVCSRLGSGAHTMGRTWFLATRVGRNNAESLCSCSKRYEITYDSTLPLLPFSSNNPSYQLYLLQNTIHHECSF